MLGDDVHPAFVSAQQRIHVCEYRNAQTLLELFRMLGDLLRSRFASSFLLAARFEKPAVPASIVDNDRARRKRPRVVVARRHDKPSKQAVERRLPSMHRVGVVQRIDVLWDRALLNEAAIPAAGVVRAIRLAEVVVLTVAVELFRRLALAGKAAEFRDGICHR